MDKFFAAIGIAVLAIIVGAIVACAGGTIVWLCWPVVMVAAFHLPPLTWWQSICLVWIFGCLFNLQVKTKKED